MPGKMTMQVTGAKEIARRFQDPRTIAPPLKVFFTDGAKDMQREAKAIAPRLSGDYFRSIRRRTRRKKGIVVKGQAFSKLVYSRFLEHGTKRGLAPLRIMLRALLAVKQTMPQRTRKLEKDIVKHLRGGVV